MHIVLVNDYAYINGGASKIALGSATKLAALGHQVTLFTAVGPIAPDLLNVPGLQIICLDQHEILEDPNRLRAMVQGIWNSRAEEHMRTVLRGLSPAETVVHVHLWTKALSASVVRAAVSLGFRVVITLHDYFVACPAGTLFNHPRKEICHLRPMSAACVLSNCDSRSYAQKLWRVSRQWVQLHAGSLPSGVDDFISISDLSESILRPLVPASSKIHRVPNFIDAQAGPLVDVAANTLFSFSGRLSPEKGPNLLAACSQKLGIDTLFIGDGPMREELERTTPHVSCTGWLSSTEAAAQLRRSRALVFPSLWYETQGLVVAEAAAMGIPVIVPDTSAAREWVVDGVTGLWFRGGDADDLAEKIRSLEQQPLVAAKMGQEAYRMYWESAVTLEIHCKKLEQVYRSILICAERARGLDNHLTHEVA